MKLEVSSKQCDQIGLNIAVLGDFFSEIERALHDWWSLHSAKKNRWSEKAMIIFNCDFSQKRHFSSKKWQKYLLNHNIGPRSSADALHRRVHDERQGPGTGDHPLPPRWTHLVSQTADALALVGYRVARFFLVQKTKTGKIYQITTNYTKCP
jgi:hypothetical protein